MSPYDHDQAPGPIPFDSFTLEVLAMYAPPLRAQSTRNKMRWALRIAAGLLGPKATTADLTPGFVAAVVTARPPAESPNSTLSLLSSLRAACNYAVVRGYLRVTPFAARKRWVRPAPPGPPKYHTRAEIAAVLALLRREAEERPGWAQWRARRLYALAATLAYTGMRRNEALYLHAADAVLDSRMLLIVARKGSALKTLGSAQPVPIAEPLAPILADWLAHRLDAPGLADGVPAAVAARPVDPSCPWLFPNLSRMGPWTSGGPGQKPLDRLKAAGVRAGVAGFTALSLRHSFASHAEYWGLSPAEIQRVLRHTNLRTQWHYRHADAANMRSAVRNVGFDAGPGEPPPAAAP